MSTLLTNRDAYYALRGFLSDFRGQLLPLGNRGGFSGAGIWRVEGASSPLCLKAWPLQGIDASRLEHMHAHMARARASGLAFIPSVWACSDRTTWIRSSGRIWDLQTWMPGRANFHKQPTTARLTAAIRAVAQIHKAWQAEDGPIQPCPSVIRRLDALADWNSLLNGGWRYAAEQVLAPAWRPLLGRAWDLTQIFGPRLRLMLEAWRDKPVALQPCIGDVWHDHILFEGERVSGVIDFGAVRLDHPAADLGRLIGSLVGDDDSGWATALAAYRAVCPFTWEAEALARLLDRSGIVVSLFNWLRWCGRGERKFDDSEAVSTHLTSLVERVEGWRVVGAVVRAP